MAIICCACICIGCVACGGERATQDLPNAYTDEEVIALFQEHKELFLKLPKICESERFWELGRAHKTATSASLIYPLNKTDALHVFSTEDKKVICEFFETLKPYMVSVRYQEYLEISFINEDRSATYNIFYQYGRTEGDRYPLKTPESNIFRKANENGNVYKDLKQNGWGFYYTVKVNSYEAYSQDNDSGMNNID